MGGDVAREWSGAETGRTVTGMTLPRNGTTGAGDSNGMASRDGTEELFDSLWACP